MRTSTKYELHWVKAYSLAADTYHEYKTVSDYCI